MFEPKLWLGRKQKKDISKTIFVHVPKCGGTTIEKALNKFYYGKNRPLFSRLETEPNINFRSFMETLRIYSDNQNTQNNNDYQGLSQALLAYKMSRSSTLLSGHFTISEILLANFSHDYSFITILRDPSDRWISNYIYSRIRLSQKGLRNEVKSLKDELLFFIESDSAKEEGSIYSFYFGEKKRMDFPASDNTLNQAINNLSMFNIIGFLDSIDDFKKKLENNLGVKLNFEHARKTIEEVDPLGYRYQEYRNLFDSNMTEIIKELCQADYKIYNYCQKEL